MIYRNRPELLGEYIVEHCATVRAAAAEFGISKSTVHKDVTEILKRENRGLYLLVKKILEQNKAERHLRGGEATKRKYSLIRSRHDKTGISSPRKNE